MASSFSLSPDTSSSTFSSGDGGFANNRGYIEHTVTKLDTVAGIAIKYGVEVADVKRMNGLVTDLQMFALPSLRIPLPGRHMPSSLLSSDQVSPRYEDYRSPPQSKSLVPYTYGLPSRRRVNRPADKKPMTSAMGLLRGYYGLASPAVTVAGEGTEMSVYKSDSDYHSEDEPFSPPVLPNLPDRRMWQCADGHVTLHRKSASFDTRSTSQELFAVESTTVTPGHHRRASRDRLESPASLGDMMDGDRSSERPVRRRSKVEVFGCVESTSEVPDRLDAGTVDKNISPARTSLPTRSLGSRVRESETPGSSARPATSISSNGLHASGESPFSAGGSGGKGLGSALLGGNTVENFISKIRRTASATLLQDDKFSFITPTRNRGDSTGSSLVPQVSSQPSSRSSVLEGLVKPGSVRRNKAALD